MAISKMKATIGALLLAGAGFAAPLQADPVKLWGASATTDAYHGFLFLGNPLGFYKDLGVEVEFGTAAGSSATLQLLASGQVDMGYIGMDVLMLAKQTNPALPVTAVYLQDRENIYEIVVPAKSDIQSVKDLDGKVIGVANLASGALPNLRGMLDEAGLNANNSVGLIPVGNSAQAATALETGRVDALSLFRAQHALIETLGVEFRYFTREAPSAVIAVNSDFLAKNRDKVVKVLQGVAMGSAFAEANPSAAVKEFWKLYGMPQGVSEDEAMKRSSHVLSSTAKVWKSYEDDSVTWGQMDDATWSGMQDFLIKQKQLKEPLPTEGLYTLDLLPEVAKVDVSAAVERAKAYK